MKTEAGDVARRLREPALASSARRPGTSRGGRSRDRPEHERSSGLAATTTHTPTATGSNRAPRRSARRLADERSIVDIRSLMSTILVLSSMTSSVRDGRDARRRCRSRRARRRSEQSRPRAGRTSRAISLSRRNAASCITACRASTRRSRSAPCQRSNRSNRASRARAMPSQSGRTRTSSKSAGFDRAITAPRGMPAAVATSAWSQPTPDPKRSECTRPSALVIHARQSRRRPLSGAYRCRFEP